MLVIERHVLIAGPQLLVIANQQVHAAPAGSGSRRTRGVRRRTDLPKSTQSFLIVLHVDAAAQALDKYPEPQNGYHSDYVCPLLSQVSRI